MKKILLNENLELKEKIIRLKQIQDDLKELLEEENAIKQYLIEHYNETQVISNDSMFKFDLKVSVINVKDKIVYDYDKMIQDYQIDLEKYQQFKNQTPRKNITFIRNK